ncbi:hypothetical protein K469DRAFT_74830 [Zopfia rhizophila CBS 207.26]|uniref:Uncharacterized protein n=1 Tax=Zopfia rhizophila CBS 207.26 TaxID=1314779 RepID=A0A6A6EAZ0_9PEZI|nr:hypothetical protein K469DRAFT_74830 [Zopfia rhizophila CBS 207.26]
MIPGCNLTQRAVDSDPVVPPSKIGLETNRDFTFESREIVLEDRSRASNRSRKHENPNGSNGEQPGCRYRGTFKRKYELQRHMKKHAKRRSTHVQSTTVTVKAHADDDICHSPVPECKMEPLPLDLMTLHAHYRDHDQVNRNLWCSLVRKRQCLLKECRLDRRFGGSETPTKPLHC